MLLLLHAVIPPVQANVLHLSTEYSLPISKAVRDVFLPTLSEVIWFQNSEQYHFSMFQASKHLLPVPASEEEVEVDAVNSVVNQLCPVTILLDRVVLTSTGVLLGCWQETNVDSELKHFHELVARLNSRIVGTKVVYFCSSYFSFHLFMALILLGSNYLFA
ncbi:hypothetical protein Hanom_Chr09g00859481 [Helianthus anomalus]